MIFLRSSIVKSHQSSLVKRCFSTQKFDSEMAYLYEKIAKNHYHECGPFHTILKSIKKYRAGMSGDFRVLDLAAGNGEPSCMIAKEFPNAHVTCTDISEDMIALAEASTAKLPNVTVALADMADLQFESNSFDLITCSYGFMFPNDKNKAISEAHRCLKDGGYLMATTWNKLPFMKFTADIMTEVLGETPPPPPLNPMSLSEPNLFENMLKDNGFQDVQSSTSTYPMIVSSDHELKFKTLTMLVKDKLDEVDGWDKARRSFDALSDKYITVDEDGTCLVDGNTFKLTICRK